MTGPPAAVQRLIDRAEIAELVSRYGVMADEQAFDDAEAVLTEDAVAEYPFGRHEGRAAVADSGRRALGAFERTQHVLTNLVVAVEGDRATVRANLIAVHVHRADQPGVHFDMGGWYRFAARRTADGWRLSHVRLTPVWTAGATTGPHADRLTEPGHDAGAG